MDKIVKVGNESIPVIEWKGQRVITTSLLAGAYETSVDNVKMNFKRHKDNFSEGTHYFLLQGEELKNFKNLVTDSYLVDKRTPQLYLWTQRGANRHCKILDTDKAWEQFDNLEEVYFKTKENLFEIPKDYPTALRAYADEIERRQIAEQKIESLNTENNLLAEKTLEWADRSLINALVRAYGHSMDDDYGRAWRDFKKELLYRHSININSRITKQLNETGKKPKTLSVLDDSELSRALSTATALCRDNDVDISDILKKKKKAG